MGPVYCALRSLLIEVDSLKYLGSGHHDNQKRTVSTTGCFCLIGDDTSSTETVAGVESGKVDLIDSFSSLAKVLKNAKDFRNVTVLILF